MSSFFNISEKIKILPIIYGSGDFAQEVRKIMLKEKFDCLAIPLPPSFQEQVEKAVELLPSINIVAMSEQTAFDTTDSIYDDISDSQSEIHNPKSEISDVPTYNYVPIDPCQGVITGIRIALQERIERAFIDLEVKQYEPYTTVLPDPYALKKVNLEKFCASVLLGLTPPPKPSQQWDRIRWMAFQLHKLELEYDSILFICSIMDWPWIRESYRLRLPYPKEENFYSLIKTYFVKQDNLYFVLGELPYITYLYEKRRKEFETDENISIDGIKELLIEARERWLKDKKKTGSEIVHNWITPQLLKIYFQYVRNLTLMDSRLTPDLYTLALSAKQTAGDDFAIKLIETARTYPYQIRKDSSIDEIAVGIDKALFPDNEVVIMKNRLKGITTEWRTLPLKPPPPKIKKAIWKKKWDPFGQCSWPPEDDKIESFHLHVRDQARAIIGADLARTEKFTTSIKDGIDIRETLRNWYTGDIYVKEIPPTKGDIEVVVFLFDVPADIKKYPWCATWYAEHEQESTLCFYATDFKEQMVGPGIGMSIYGGCFFLYPPRHIPDIWYDLRFSFAKTLEERLLAGAFFHSTEKRIALVSPNPPLIEWRRLARMYKKQIVYIPLSRFSQQTIDRLRRFHVLNGHSVRSYAAKFIRE